MEYKKEVASLKERFFARKQKIKKALFVVDAYKAFFSSDNGKIILKDLAEKCFVFSPVTDVSNMNGFSMVSAFNDGKRAAFLDVLKMTGVAEEKLVEELKKIGEENNE